MSGLGSDSVDASLRELQGRNEDLERASQGGPAGNADENALSLRQLAR